MKQFSSTNLRNRVTKLHLPKTKSLYPLFEVISNSIHAIDEKKQLDSSFNGSISIRTTRNGDVNTLRDLENIEQYPINSFDIVDNGIGLNHANMKSFAEFDSEKKASIGGKGIGRLVCLKAFRKMRVWSCYEEKGQIFERKFDYVKTKDGFEGYEDGLQSEKKVTGTVIKLMNYEEIYQKATPKELFEIARQVIVHFQLYFIQGIEPEIIIIDQNGVEVNLTNLYTNEFEREILLESFNIGSSDFKLFISKSHTAKSHRIHYCAHQRTVRDEGLSKFLSDLKAIVENGNKSGYYFQVFVVGEFLNRNVNEARTGFNFSTEEDEEDTESNDITLASIRRSSIQCIEDLLSEFLSKVRTEKLAIYYPIIEEQFPNYASVITYNKEKVERLPTGLTTQELDVKLYEIESEWRVKVKTEGIDLIDKKKDITTLEEYKELYGSFLSKFNDIGQSDLARYIVHRRSVIDLLDKLIELNDQESFASEDIVHSLFFPIRESGDTVSSDKQNLWLIDERLTYNSLLASDKLFKQIPSLNSPSSKRVDLIIKQEDIFNNATLFSEETIPFESFTIIEFKKPERDDYTHGDIKKDPIKQVRSYVDETIAGKIKVKGKAVSATENTPFYCYIIADITPSLLKILEYESFNPTPDGLGYFRFYDTKLSRAYIEVLPFNKVIRDAKKRNKILFDKLKIS